MLDAAEGPGWQSLSIHAHALEGSLELELCFCNILLLYLQQLALSRAFTKIKLISYQLHEISVGAISSPDSYAAFLRLNVLQKAAKADDDCQFRPNPATLNLKLLCSALTSLLHGQQIVSHSTRLASAQTLGWESQTECRK